MQVSRVVLLLLGGVLLGLEAAVLDCWQDGDCLAQAVERALDWDVPLFDGVTLRRNGANATAVGRSAVGGLARLRRALGLFLDSHTLSIDLSRQLQSDDFKDGYQATKVSKKERKYFHYTMMVLLGIFGLSAPLIMKTLALIAGKALIASKIALLMVGSVALKKIFQSDGDSGVKVHTHTIPIHEDEHDRFMDASAYSFYNNNNNNNNNHHNQGL